MKAKDIEDQVKDLESIKNNYQLHVNVLEIKEQRYKLLKTKEKVFEEREAVCRTRCVNDK